MGFAVAVGPKNLGMSRPAVVCSPAGSMIATHRLSSFSKVVRCFDSWSISSGVMAFFFAMLSSEITQT
jgi:hypothetical protein